MVAVEKAKERVQAMVKKRNAEDIETEPLYPTFKKSRVVPKSSGVMTEDETKGAEAGIKNKLNPSTAAGLDDSHCGGTNAEGAAAVTESQKNDTEPAEVNKAKKSLPFIGKLPFLKSARTAKQAASEQNAGDDKSKIDIKVNVSPTMITAMQSEPPSVHSDMVTMTAQLQAEPNWPVTVKSSYMETGNMGEQNSLDAFLSIGDPESGHSQAVPVFNVGPQTRSEYLLANPPDKKQTTGANKTSSLPTTSENAALADSSVSETAIQSYTGTITVPSQSTDMKVGYTVEAAGDAQLSASTEITDVPAVEKSVPTSSSSVDHEDNSAMSLDIEDNTEDYLPETEQITMIPRDDEIAQLLPQISATWMEPDASGYSVLSDYVFI